MSHSTSDDAYLVADETVLRRLYRAPSERAQQKCFDALDRHAREFVARSPFLCLSTQDRLGRADVSPRGDPSGFVTVLDDTTLAIPDRPGNNRLDSLSNILINPSVGLLFLVPGFDETLRVNDRAQLSVEPALLESMAVNGRTPTLAIVVFVDEVFLHCAKALRRSRLWDQEAHQDRRGMPTLSKMLLEQTASVPEDPAEMKRIDAELEAKYRDTMY